MESTPRLDMERIEAYTSIFCDIVEKRIPAFRDRYGVGSQVEWNVINMLRAALDCAERCATLAAADPVMAAAFERRAQTVRDLIENAEADRKAWLETEAWIALAEGEGQTKH